MKIVLASRNKHKIEEWQATLKKYIDGVEILSLDDVGIFGEIEEDGKTFRYYNSFCCPHCGAPYIDYKKNPGMKQFGVSGCVHLGRKAYHAGSKTSA